MTPSLIALKRGLKSLTDNLHTACIPDYAAVDPPNGLADDAIPIELRPSRLHAALLGALASLSLSACLYSQLPWLYSIAAVSWVLASLLHWRFNPQRARYLIDNGETWLVTDLHGTQALSYQRADYCTASLLVMSFTGDSRKRIRVFVWRDAVTPAAFSWLTARMTLSDADAPVQNVATSSPIAVFSFSKRLDC